MEPESTASFAAESLLVVIIMLLGMLPTGELRTKPKIVIVQGEPASMGAPVGDSLRPPTFLIARYSEVIPIVSRYALLILDLKVNCCCPCPPETRKKPFGYHRKTAFSLELELAANDVLGVN